MGSPRWRRSFGRPALLPVQSPTLHDLSCIMCARVRARQIRLGRNPPHPSLAIGCQSALEDLIQRRGDPLHSAFIEHGVCHAIGVTSLICVPAAVHVREVEPPYRTECGWGGDEFTDGLTALDLDHKNV